jgi:hypothetical protein
MSLFGCAEVCGRNCAQPLRLCRLLPLEVVDFRREFVIPSSACFGICCRGRHDAFMIASHGGSPLLQG